MINLLMLDGGLLHSLFSCLTCSKAVSCIFIICVEDSSCQQFVMKMAVDSRLEIMTDLADGRRREKF